MLAGERRSAQLPDNFAGLPADSDDGRNVAETYQQVSVGKFDDRVAMCPLGTTVLDAGNDVFGRIEMLPSAPLPKLSSSAESP